MNVTCARVICVADEQIDVADHGRLVREIPHVGAEVIRVGRRVDTDQIDEPFCVCGQPLDETRDIIGAGRLPPR